MDAQPKQKRSRRGGGKKDDPFLLASSSDEEQPDAKRRRIKEPAAEQPTTVEPAQQHPEQQTPQISGPLMNVNVTVPEMPRAFFELPQAVSEQQRPAEATIATAKPAQQHPEQQTPHISGPLMNVTVTAPEVPRAFSERPQAVSEQQRPDAEATIATAKPASQDEKEQKKLAKKLWTWYRQIDMQLVTHIGNEETDQCWKTLEKAKQLKDLIENPELLNLLASLHEQYLSGFTGKAERKP